MFHVELSFTGTACTLGPIAGSPKGWRQSFT